MSTHIGLYCTKGRQPRPTREIWLATSAALFSARWTADSGAAQENPERATINHPTQLLFLAVPGTCRNVSSPCELLLAVAIAAASQMVKMIRQNKTTKSDGWSCVQVVVAGYLSFLRCCRDRINGAIRRHFPRSMPAFLLAPARCTSSARPSPLQPCHRYPSIFPTAR